MKKERFVLRLEPGVKDPISNPIKAILFDRNTGVYNLLTEEQKKQVLSAVKNTLNNNFFLESKSPFAVSVDLKLLYGRTKILRIGDPGRNILSAPLAAYFEISSSCNMNCKDCYQGLRKEENPLSLVEIRNFLKQFSDMGGIMVRITGKEPTTHPHLFAIIKEGRRLGLKMGVNTNGYLELPYINKLADSGVQEVVVSIDGDRKYHDSIRKLGSYDRAVQTVKQLIIKGIDTRINMTIAKNNIDDLEYVMRLARTIGSYVSIIPMRNLGNATESFCRSFLSPKEMMEISKKFIVLQQELESIPRSYTYFNLFSPKPRYYHQFFQMDPCVARKNIFVDCGGNIFPCDHLVVLGDIFKGGNLRDNKLIEIWKFGKGLERYRKIKRNKKCQSCQEFGVRCDGGCSSEYLVTVGGSVTEVHDRLCFKHLI